MIVVGKYYSRPKGGYCSHLVVKVTSTTVYTEAVNGKKYEFTPTEFVRDFELETE